jgi:hypothetical protein
MESVLPSITDEEVKDDGEQGLALKECELVGCELSEDDGFALKELHSLTVP